MPRGWFAGLWTAAAPVPRVRVWLAFLAALVMVVGPFVLFAALDSRAPNDHDNYYTDLAIRVAPLVAEADSWDEFNQALRTDPLTGRRPPAVQQLLAVHLGLTGLNRLNFRLFNLPFLGLLFFGLYLAGTELRDRRTGVTAALVLCTLPVFCSASRKFLPFFHGAALASITVAVLLCCVKRPARWGPWVALGALQAARCFTHPVAWFDVGATFVMVAVCAGWPGSQPGRLGAALRGTALAVVLTLLGTSYLLGLWAPAPDWAVPNYLLHRGHMFVTTPDAALESTIRVAAWLWTSYLMPVPALLLLGGSGPALAACGGRRRSALSGQSCVCSGLWPSSSR